METYRMIGKILLALCALSCINHATSMHLTKDISADERSQALAPYERLLEAAESIKDVDIRTELVKLVLGTPDQAVRNLADLLISNEQPEVDDVLSVFNSGLGVRLLIINDAYVQVDADELELIMSQNARSLSRFLYPKDYLQQALVFGMLQSKVMDISREIRPIVADKKIPVEDFNAVISSRKHAVSKRDVTAVQQRDLLSDLLQSVQLALCEAVVNSLYSQVNNTLTSYQTFLKEISIASSDNVITNFVAIAVELGISLAEQALTFINDLVASLSKNICSEIIVSNSTGTVSRKRREVESSDGALVDMDMDRAVANRDLLTDLWSLIWSLISTVFNSVLSSLASSFIADLQTRADTLIESVVGTFLYGLIDSIFPK